MCIYQIQFSRSNLFALYVIFLIYRDERARRNQSQHYGSEEMSGKGKRKDEQDYASEGDSEGRVPPKKSVKKDSDDSDGIVVCEVTLKFQSHLQICIRVSLLV